MKTLETIKNEIEAKATEAVIHEDEQNNKLVPLSARLADYYEMKRNPPKKLSTGFSTLDEILGGGLEESGRLLILGAKTHVGKTQYCLNIAYSIAKQGKPIIYFSLEMSAAEIIDRIISIDPQAAENGVLDRFFCIEREVKRAEDGRLWSNSTIEALEEQIESSLKELAEKPIIFVDYLQLLTSLDLRLDQRIIMKQAVMIMNYYAKNRKLSFVVISALANDDTDFSSTNYKESGDIGYTADICIKLERNQGQPTITAHINKNRQTGKYGEGAVYVMNIDKLHLSDGGYKNKAITAGQHGGLFDGLFSDDEK